MKKEKYVCRSCGEKVTTTFTCHLCGAEVCFDCAYSTGHGAECPDCHDNNKNKKCIDNSTYEDCLTIGKIYKVRENQLKDGLIMYYLIDDNNNPLNTLINRFE